MQPLYSEGSRENSGKIIFITSRRCWNRVPPEHSAPETPGVVVDGWTGVVDGAGANSVNFPRGGYKPSSLDGKVFSIFLAKITLARALVTSQ